MGHLIYGVGVNDLPRGVCSEVVDGKKVMHFFYKKWSSMLLRCYSQKFLSRHPSYQGCSVCDEWKVLSGFKKWIDQQPIDRLSWDLDKDLLSNGSKVYSPETCILVPSWLNIFVIDRKNQRGKYMTGCNFHKLTGKFVAQISDRNGKRHHLGLFNDELSAHLAWKAAKLQMVIDMKGELDMIDERLYTTLVSRYS